MGVSHDEWPFTDSLEDVRARAHHLIAAADALEELDGAMNLAHRIRAVATDALHLAKLVHRDDLDRTGPDNHKEVA